MTDESAIGLPVPAVGVDSIAGATTSMLLGNISIPGIIMSNCLFVSSQA
jgi:hypothetical protein